MTVHIRAALVLSLAGLAAGVAAGGAAAGDWELKVCADPDNLPFSNDKLEGFDNRIAEIVARELGADLSWVWLPDVKGRTRQLYVQGGACDMVMGVIDSQPGFLTSYAYYRTGYVFLYPEGAGFEVKSLDDPVLRDLRIGFPGGSAKTVPPSIALANRGIVANQVHFIDRRDEGKRYAPVLEALGAGEIDLAVAWGPLAGAYAKREGALVLAPVKPEIDAPFIPMVASLTIGVRPDDEGLRDDIDRALAAGWDEIRAVLTDAGVPLIDLPQPVVGDGG